MPEISKQRRIFVARDTVLGGLLDAVSADLIDLGHEVLRGNSPFETGIEPNDREDQLQRIRNCDVLVATPRFKCPRAVIEDSPRLRGVVFPTIGIESIDADAATSLGLVIAHGPTKENVIGMAEATVMFMVALMLRLHEKEQLLATSAPRPANSFGRLMYGKRVGIVGFGRIGRAVAERLSGWGVDILVYSRSAGAKAEETQSFRSVPLEKLLADSDIVTLHLDLSPSTRNMIGGDQLRLMKPSAYLINTSRGGLVDEAALCDALRNERLAGAALDTFEVEPLPPDSPLRDLRNVILTPHMIGHSSESQESFRPVLLENITRLLAGDLPLFIKNPDAVGAWRRRMSEIES